MPTSMIDLSGYGQAQQALGQLLEDTMQFRDSSDFSVAPDSDYQRASALIDQINELIGQLATLELREIDEAVAQSGIVDEINGLATEAKEEADELKQTAKTINGIAHAISTVADVVTKIAGLPFL